MCKKIREGKVLSPPSDDEKEDTIPNDWEKVTTTTTKTSKKKRSKKKTKSKICKTCGQDILSNEMRGMLMFQDTYHQFLAKDYCKEHEAIYSDQKCKPHWCGDCNYLVKYDIEVQK